MISSRSAMIGSEEGVGGGTGKGRNTCDERGRAVDHQGVKLVWLVRRIVVVIEVHGKERQINSSQLFPSNSSPDAWKIERRKGTRCL